MRENVLNFIVEGKAKISEQLKKQALERQNQPSWYTKQVQNSIFNQLERIRLEKNQLKQIQQSVTHLETARGALVSAIASLEGFRELNKRELILAANFTDGNIYMLTEFLHQQKSTLNTEALNRGQLKGVY